SRGLPAGQSLGGNFTGVDVVQPAGGAYTILTMDNARHPVGGPYGLALLRTVNACGGSASQGQTLTAVVGAATPFLSYSIPAAAAPLLCGGAVGGSLTSANPFRFYSTAAAQDDVLRLLLTRGSDNFSPRVDLYDPTGAFIASTLDLTQKAKLDGNYLVLVSP